MGKRKSKVEPPSDDSTRGPITVAEIIQARIDYLDWAIHVHAVQGVDLQRYMAESVRLEARLCNLSIAEASAVPSIWVPIELFRKPQ